MSERTNHVGETLERVAVWRHPALPGVELKTIENTARRWCVFYESYAIVSSARGVSGRRFLGETIERAPGELMLYEPGDFATNTFFEPNSVLRVVSIESPVLQRVLGTVVPLAASARRFRRAAIRSSDLAALIEALADSLACTDEDDRATGQLTVTFASMMRELGAQQSFEYVAPEPEYVHRHAVRVRDQLHADLCGDRLIEAVAGDAGMTAFRLTRVFKARFGAGPNAYRQALRVARARKLLRAGRQPNEVARLLEFSDVSHFRRTFTKYVGLTPSEYAG